jgi:RNA polymerase sigma-70 factor, ECF subfamily
VNVVLAPKSTVRLRSDIKARIGQQLRAMYSDVVNPGVPDRFSEILRMLDQADEADTDRKGEKGARMAPPNKSVRDVMLAAVPSLRAFTISLSGNVDRADDLVQETLLRAWANLDTFEPGTNMSAWLVTILRNLFRSEYRKRRREVEDADDSYAESLTSPPDQSSHLEMDEFRRALELLPIDQRESLILVGASGFSYEEAAQICDCAVGTVKSRVNRARSRLAAILSIESAVHSVVGQATGT